MAVDLSFFRSETAQKLRTEGRTEGLAEGLLLVLDQRSVTVPDDVRERIGSCADHDILTAWMVRALTVNVAADLFDETERDARGDV